MYELHPHPDLEKPILVMALEGWIDAGFGAANALVSIGNSIKTEPVATFDSDALIDHRGRRPMVRIVEGVNTGISWPTIELSAGHDNNGQSVLLLTGPEPDFRWRAFAENITDLAKQFDVSLATAIGAFPAPAPHTRAVKLASSASSSELARQVGFVSGTVEVPAGIHAVVEQSLSAAEIPSVGLWARVPHYVSAMPYPAASAALVDGLAEVSGVQLDSSDLHEAAHETRTRIDELISNSPEHSEMVRQLEEQADSEDAAPLPDLADLPTGDEIAAELERFLRGEI